MSEPTGPGASSMMARETREAPQAVARQIAANRGACESMAGRFTAAAPRLVATCARGSSDHAATYAKYLVETTLGVPVTSSAPSIGSVYDAPMDYEGCLFVVISQSGGSPDLVANAEWARRNGAFVVSLLNEVDSPVGHASDLVLALHAGAERSVAATKSYIASLCAVLQLVAHISTRRDLLEGIEALPEALARALTEDWSDAVVPLASADDLLVVGRGLGLGVAQEAALKLKETASIHAEALSAAELMHGPLALVRDRYPVLAFSQEDRTRASVSALIATLREKGARVLVAEQGPPSNGRLPVAAGLHPAIAPIAMIQSFYVMAEAIARARGHDPDRPPHLTKVTYTR